MHKYDLGAQLFPDPEASTIGIGTSLEFLDIQLIDGFN